MSRMSAHNAALMSVLPSGLARAHRGNPAAALRVETLYGLPVLLSCLGSQVLSCTEINMLKQHYKESLQRLQKLHKGTPDTVVYFLGGSLPLPALLDMRCLSLLNIIAQLGPSHILHRIGRSILSDTKPCRFLWFSKIRETCSKYSLPDPLSILNNPPPKQALKKLIKSKVMEFWEANLRLTSSSLPSLEYFKCQLYSLSKPHPIWISAGSNP